MNCNRCNAVQAEVKKSLNIGMTKNLPYAISGNLALTSLQVTSLNSTTTE